MKNPIKELYNNLPMETLEKIVKEIHESEDTGILSDTSELRIVIEQVQKITMTDYSSTMFGVTISVIKEYSYRKAGLK